MDPLQVAMTGVRMGERFLQVFCNDTALTRGLATKAGLSGMAALAAPDEAQSRRAQQAAAKAGVLIDLKTGPVTTLDWPAATFDMVVIDNTAGDFSALGDGRGLTLAAAHAVLRPGGRVEIIESIGGGLFRSATPMPPDYTQAGGAEGALRTAGFQPVRVLAEKDGYRFVEGLRAGQ